MNDSPYGPRAQEQNHGLAVSTLGRYRILERIAIDGPLATYRAENVSLSRDVVLKVFSPSEQGDPAAADRFVSAARAVAAIDHPNVGAIYEIGESGGHVFFAQAGASGRTLRTRMLEGPLPTATAVDIVAQIARGLAAAHAKRVTHGRLSADTVIIQSDTNAHVAVAKIVDFGLQEADRAEDSSNTPARRDTQLRQVAQEDIQKDISSLGEVLRALAPGISPTAESGARPGSNPLIEIQRILAKLEAKDSPSRYPNANAVVADLQTVAAKLAAASAASVASIERRNSRRVWVSMGVAATIAALAMLLASTTSEDSRREPLISRPLTTFPGSERDVSFSPDGAQVVFARKTQERADFDLYLMGVGTGGIVRLTDSNADEVEPAWSPDGRWIAFVVIDTPNPLIKLISPLGGAERVLTHMRAPQGPINTSISWLPDSSGVLYTQAADGSPPTIWRVSLSTGQPEQVLRDPSGVDRFPEVSAATGELAFVRHLGGYRYTIMARREGEQERTVFAATTGFWGIAWSADGREVLFGRPLRPHQEPLLWRIRVAGGEPELIGGLGVGSGPASSPDGTRLAYERQYLEGGIRRYKANGPQAAPPPSVAPSSALEWTPRLSPDQARLAFVSNRSGSDQIWVAAADGSRAVQLTDIDGTVGGPEWSPDGTLIVFDVAHGDQSDIFVIDSAGGPPRAVVAGGGDNGWPTWSPDGQWIYFTSNRGGGSEVWKVPAAGGEPAQVTHEGGNSPQISPDGRYLYYVKGRTGSELWRAPIDNSEEAEVVWNMSVPEQGPWIARDDGLFFIDLDEAAEASLEWVLRYLSFQDGSTQVHVRLGQRRPHSIKPVEVSADGNTVLFAGIDRDESDLMIVEGFR